MGEDVETMMWFICYNDLKSHIQYYLQRVFKLKKKKKKVGLVKMSLEFNRHIEKSKKGTMGNWRKPCNI